MTYNPGHHPMKATAQRDITLRINEHDFLDSNVGIALNELRIGQTGTSVYMESDPGEVGSPIPQRGYV